MWDLWRIAKLTCMLLKCQPLLPWTSGTVWKTVSVVKELMLSHLKGRTGLGDLLTCKQLVNLMVKSANPGCLGGSVG